MAYKSKQKRRHHWVTEGVLIGREMDHPRIAEVIRKRFCPSEMVYIAVEFRDEDEDGAISLLVGRAEIADFFSRSSGEVNAYILSMSLSPDGDTDAPI